MIMADETTDITATEQLSLCLRYYDHDLKKVCEDFICFLDVLDKEYHSNTNPEIVINQETIPTTMTDFLQRCEEENQSAFEIQEPKLTGKVIGKALEQNSKNVDYLLTQLLHKAMMAQVS